MGQYSQWLYHREVDQQLRERLTLLEQELHALQEQAAQLEDPASGIDNPILQAIAMQQSAEALLEDSPAVSSTDTDEQSIKSFSPALFAWSSLPNLDTQKIQLPDSDLHNTLPETMQHPSIPHSAVNLLPPDMATFIDTHQQTQPQLQLPRWLHKAKLTPNTIAPQKAVPDERTDVSIQRWLERWGKTPQSPTLFEHKTPQEGPEHE